jgi:hypothetical protein
VPPVGATTVTVALALALFPELSVAVKVTGRGKLRG